MIKIWRHSPFQLYIGSFLSTVETVKRLNGVGTYRTYLDSLKERGKLASRKLLDTSTESWKLSDLENRFHRYGTYLPYLLHITQGHRKLLNSLWLEYIYHSKEDQ